AADPGGRGRVRAELGGAGSRGRG
ncbi:MAG: hypothetical protein AVDCRST_MAG59-5141, partial [uncultured Thermomicrobiales bacterium]